jgi:hypothetical protein
MHHAQLNLVGGGNVNKKNVKNKLGESGDKPEEAIEMNRSQ